MALAPDDPVVTPSGRRAVVKRRMPDGRLECRYLERARGELRDDGLVVLDEKYLRLILAGKEMPAPMRVGGLKCKPPDGC